MTESSKPREVWITTHPESLDEDKLTHIALFKFYPNANPIRFIEASAHDAALARIKLLEEVCAELMGACERIARDNLHTSHYGESICKDTSDGMTAKQALASAREKIGGVE